LDTGAFRWICPPSGPGGPSPNRIGTSEWNYRLAHDGWQTLKDHGIVEGNNYQPAELNSIAYAEHDLQVNALVLHIAQAIAAPQNTPLLNRMPFLWQGPRTGRIDPQTPAAVQASDAARIPPEDRLHHAQSRYGYLEPDATLTAQIGTDRFAILIEYDRTGRSNKQIDRLRRYDYWLLDGWRHTHFAAHAIPPTVLILTAKPGPLASLIQTADKTLTAWHGPPHANPAEGIYPGRQRIIFTTRDNILESNWTMYRTPSLPSSASKQASRTPRTVDYNPLELFRIQKR
jgi:hypothetical protein